MVNNGKIQLFFTYIKEKPIVQLIGLLTFCIIILSMVCKDQWQQHLSDDATIVKSLKEENARVIRLYENEISSHQDTRLRFMDYVQDVKHNNDSVFNDNRKFLNDLRRIKDEN